MSNPQLLILSLLILSTFGSVKELTKQSFKTVFKKEFQQFTSELSVSREYFILFYSPQFENSLEVREIFHHVANQHERQTIDKLKSRGVTQFEEFQQHFEKTLQLVEIDCGENQQICNHFKPVKFPTILFINKQNKVYLYQAHMSTQQLYYFISRVDDRTVDMRYLRTHQVKSSGVSDKIQSLLKNQIFKYLLVFLVAPFLFGYFVMSKQKKQTQEAPAQNKNKKIASKPKQSKKND